jgi:soluble lytic murein transglycosylase-like protein
MRIRAAIAILAILGAVPAFAEAPGREQYRSMLRAAAALRGIPFELADAVMAVESGYNPQARGDAGEVGLMQVMPPTAELMDPKITVAALAEPRTNIALGTRYLADAWKLAKQDVCTAVMKYRAGHGETRFSVKSVNYCVAVRRHMTRAGYKVTGKVPKAEFGFAASTATGATRSKGPIIIKGRVRVEFGGGGCAIRIAGSRKCLR